MIPEHTLNAIGSLLGHRDRIGLLPEEKQASLLREIADECPGLLSEVRRLNLQIDEAKKAIATVQIDKDETPLADRLARLTDRFRGALRSEDETHAKLEAMEAENRRLVHIEPASIKALNARIEELKAQVDREHACAEELKEGCQKQYAEFAEEMDAKDRLNSALRDGLLKYATHLDSCKSPFCICGLDELFKQTEKRNGSSHHCGDPNAVCGGECVDAARDAERCCRLDPSLKAPLPCVKERGHSGHHEDQTGCWW